MTYAPPYQSTIASNQIGSFGSMSFEGGAEPFADLSDFDFSPRDNRQMKDLLKPSNTDHGGSKRSYGYTGDSMLKRQKMDYPADVTHRATITPDDAIRPTVEIKNPSLSLFLDDDAAPSLPNLHHGEGGFDGKVDNSGFAVPPELLGLDAAKFEELFPKLDDYVVEPIQLDAADDQTAAKDDYRNGSTKSANSSVDPPTEKADASVLSQKTHQADPTNTTANETIPLVDGKEKVGTPEEVVTCSGIANGYVYDQLRPILPLPKALKPVVAMILEMEASGSPQSTIADACTIVKGTMRAVQPGLDGQTICGMLFESMATKLGTSVDLNACFVKSIKSGIIESPEVHKVFFKDSKVEVRVNPPPFVPTNLQLAVAYGFYYAQEAKASGLEKFVVGASYDIIHRMTEDDKERFWTAAFHSCGSPHSSIT